MEGNRNGEAHAIVRAICELREMLRRNGMLTRPLETELAKPLGQLTDVLCPYSAEELDRHVKKLDEKFPEWEHWYTRCGTTVTWHDRPRSPEHPLWHLYNHKAHWPADDDSNSRASATEGALTASAGTASSARAADHRTLAACRNPGGIS